MGSSCRIAFIGAGSFTFGPSVLRQILLDNRLSGIDLALVDVDRGAVDLMAAVGRRLAADQALDMRLSSHTQRDEALAGADFVICSAAIQGFRRFHDDCRIIDQHYPQHLITEFGGVAGISYSLRQIALIEGVVADIKRLCPRAWLLNVCNPLPRVCQASHELGARTVGFCSVSSLVYPLAWQLLGHEKEDYPWLAARANLSAVWAGLNHFTWLLELRGRAGGADLLPDLRQKVADGATVGNPRCEDIFRQSGHWLLPYDGHCHDFLPAIASDTNRTEAFHGDAAERAARLEHLRQVAAGQAELNAASSAWERPGDFVTAILHNKPTRFAALNLVNQGQLADLPRGIFVETPATVSAEGPRPDTLSLPRPALPYLHSAAAVTDTIVRAALTRSRSLVHQAVILDPTVLDKDKGLEAIDACLEAHRDVLPAYA